MLTDAAIGLKTPGPGCIDIALASRPTDTARLAFERLGTAGLDDRAQVVAPRGFDGDVHMEACYKSGAETDGQRRRAVVRLERRRRLSLHDTCVDDRDRMQCRCDTLPRPRRRGDHVAPVQHERNASDRRAKAGVDSRERCGTDVPRVRIGHAAACPRRIGVIDQHHRAARAMQCVRDGRADVAAADDDRHGANFWFVHAIGPRGRLGMRCVIVHRKQQV